MAALGGGAVSYERGPPYVPALLPTAGPVDYPHPGYSRAYAKNAGSLGGAVSYERGTPVSHTAGCKVVFCRILPTFPVSY